MSVEAAFDSVEAVTEALASQDYISNTALSTSLFLALRMEKALFLEGEPGVGKTEIAKALSKLLGAPLIRLQCYEGLDINHAVYEWNYPYQLLEIQAHQNDPQRTQAENIFTERFLLKRPLLQALDQAHTQAPVLLIDELDRADEEFESFLLEILAEYQITIPEIGTFSAAHKPVTIITSNRTREIHDALKRRCVYHWIDYPPREQEIAIVQLKVPGVSQMLAEQVVDYINLVRQQELYKLPGVAETLDWAAALMHLNQHQLTLEAIEATLGIILKVQDDVSRLRGDLSRRLLRTAVPSV